MNTIAIVQDAEDVFRATSGSRQSVGRTMGEALDALSLKLEDSEAGAMVLIQKRLPDRFFTEAQHQRLEELRTQRESLTPAEHAEWEELVNAELDATVARSDALIRQIEA